MSRPLININNLVQALDGAPGGTSRYHAFHVFADDLLEAVERRPVTSMLPAAVGIRTFTLERGERFFGLTIWERSGVLRLRRLPPLRGRSFDHLPRLTGTLGDFALQAARVARSLKGDAECPILGLLIGSKIGDSQHIFPLEFDTRAGTWHVYDGGLVSWMKDRLLGEDQVPWSRAPQKP